MSPKDEIQQGGIALNRFLQILHNQEEYRGYVISVGKVSCGYQAIDGKGRHVSVSTKSPKYPEQFYVVDIEMDKSAYEPVLIPRWDPTIRQTDFVNSIMDTSYGRNQVKIDGVNFVLHPNQKVEINKFDPFNNIIEIEIPEPKGFPNGKGGETVYPYRTTAQGIAHPYKNYNKREDRTFAFNSEHIIVEKKLGDYAAYVLNKNQTPVIIQAGDPYKKIHTFKDVIGPWVRDYIVGQRITIAVSLDVSKFVGISVSAELNWILAGKDASWAPYGTVSKGILVSGSGGVNFAVSITGNHFIEGEKTKCKDIHRDMISGQSVSGSTNVGKYKGLDVNIVGAYSNSATPDGKQDRYWTGGGGGVSVPLIKGALPLMKKADFQAIIQETSKTFHLSLQKLDKKVFDTLEKL